MSELPEPLTPPDCNLTDFGFMPLEVCRLRDSKIVDQVTGDEFRAAILLWCASWHQVPAGSLPNDDAQLAKFAGYGRVVKEWLKVKDGALYGFIACSDGRLYHPVICEKANESWASKLKHNAKMASDRQRKKARRPVETAKSSDGKEQNSDRPSAGIPTENALKGQGQGQGQEDIPLAKANGRQVAKPDDPWKEVYDYGKKLLGPSAGGIITNLKKTFDNKPRKVLAKLQDAAEQRQPIEWINAFLWQHGPPGIEVGAVHPLP